MMIASHMKLHPEDKSLAKITSPMNKITACGFKKVHLPVAPLLETTPN